MDEVDTAGYFGTNHRMDERFNQTMTPLLDIQVIVEAFAQEHYLVKLMQTIRSIDKEKNGFITNQELEDILKMLYKPQLGHYDLKPALK